MSDCCGTTGPIASYRIIPCQGFFNPISHSWFSLSATGQENCIIDAQIANTNQWYKGLLRPIEMSSFFFGRLDVHSSAQSRIQSQEAGKKHHNPADNNMTVYTGMESFMWG